MALKTWHAAFPCYSFEMMLIEVSCVYAHHFILNNNITGYFKFLEVVMVRIKTWYLWLEYPLAWSKSYVFTMMIGVYHHASHLYFLH